MAGKAKLDVAKIEKFADEVDKERTQAPVQTQEVQIEEAESVKKNRGRPKKSETEQGKRKSVGRKNTGLSSSTAMITLPIAEKEKFTRIALANGLSFSAFVRLAGNAYIRAQGWQEN